MHYFLKALIFPKKYAINNKNKIKKIKNLWGVFMKQERIIVDFVTDILQTMRIPIHFLNLLEGDSDLSFLDGGMKAEILKGTDYTQEMDNWIHTLEKGIIYHMTDLFYCSYTILWLPEAEQWMMSGPLIFKEIKYEYFEHIFQKLKLPAERKSAVQDYYLKTVLVTDQALYESIFSGLADKLYGKGKYEVIYGNEHDLDKWYQDYQNYYRIPEKPLQGIKAIEDRYELEHALIEAIEHADENKAIEAAEKLSRVMLPPRMPNALRDSKDYTITANTLMRKAAEVNGIHPIYIDALSNRHVAEIEQLANKMECHGMTRKMAREYCQLIRRHTLTGYSLLTRKVITYVNTDFRENLSLNKLAEQLSVNASYLSTLFKKEMGCTLTDYVNQRRIQHARKLLLSTDLPIKDIAASCGIPDIYYFNRLFKKHTKTTPKAYRQMDPFQKRKELAALNAGNIASSKEHPHTEPFPSDFIKMTVS